MDRLVGTIMSQFTLRPQVRTRNSVIAAVVLIFCTWLAVTATTYAPRADKLAESEATTQGRREGALYYPTPKQWASLTTAPVTEVVFRTEHLTEGKIGVDEDRATLV
ncbi:MAG TPA: efflux RND transporter periplasmic adaptor subunit, partial [Pseudolabrys sp.]